MSSEPEPEPRPDEAAPAEAAPAKAASAQAPNRSRLSTLAPILVFDVGGPLAVYYGLRAAGLSTVLSLILSGALPVLGIALSLARGRRLDAIGVLVLTGIVVGTVLGLVTGSAHAVLLDGTVPTFVFGVVCLVSLRWERPLMYRFALESMGSETPRAATSPTTGATPASGTRSGSPPWCGA
jgi:hypothetical protein